MPESLKRIANRGETEVFILKGKVNGYSKSIGLRDIFKHFLWGKN